MMKAFKAEQKTIFYEAIKHILSNRNKEEKSFEIKNGILKEDRIQINCSDLNNFNGLNKTFSLFKFLDSNSKELFEKFKSITEKIEKGNKLMKRDQLQKLKKDRGIYLFKGNSKRRISF